MAEAALDRFAEVYHPRFWALLRRADRDNILAIYASCEWWSYTLRVYLGDKASEAHTLPQAVSYMREMLRAFCESTLLQPRQVEESAHSFEAWVAKSLPHQIEVMDELRGALATEASLHSSPRKTRQVATPNPFLALPLPRFENGGDDEWQLPF